jgi:hypothetical protein
MSFGIFGGFDGRFGLMAKLQISGINLLVVDYETA